MTNAEAAMRRFEVPDLDDLPEDPQERIEEETERAGFTPNVFRAMSYRPSHFRAFFAYHDALVEETELEREEVEMIVVAVSGVNDCLYCSSLTAPSVASTPRTRTSPSNSRPTIGLRTWARLTG